MLSHVFKKLIIMGLPIALIATVIGCSANNGEVGTGGGGTSNETGMFTPHMNGNSYSVSLGTITSQVAAVVGSYNSTSCKSATSGATQSGNWSWTYDGTNPLIAMVLNDTACQVNISSFKTTTPTATYTNSGGAMLASNGTYGSITKFCNGACTTTTEVYAKAMLSWSNGTATINIAYASDPNTITATGTGSYLTTSTITNPVTGILPPDYATFSYTAGATPGGFQTDAAGYVQPTNAVTGTFNISGSTATKAQYYAIYSVSGGGALAGQTWGAAATFTPINSDLFATATANSNGHWNYSAGGYTTIPIPLYAAPTTATTLTTAWGLMTPIATQGYQPCGAAATSCSSYDNAGLASVSNTFKSFTSYLIPTLVPAAGLVYYVALANVDATTQIAAYQIATITIMP